MIVKAIEQYKNNTIKVTPMKYLKNNYGESIMCIDINDKDKVYYLNTNEKIPLGNVIEIKAIQSKKGGWYWEQSKPIPPTIKEIDNPFDWEDKTLKQNIKENSKIINNKIELLNEINWLIEYFRSYEKEMNIKLTNILKLLEVEAILINKESYIE